MGAATELTKENFAGTVGSGVTLIDFWAVWCGPCKVIAPAIDTLARQFDGKATIAKLNVDDEPDIAQEHGVQSIPTLLIFKDGQEVNRFVGVTKIDILADALDQALA